MSEEETKKTYRGIIDPEKVKDTIKNAEKIAREKVGCPGFSLPKLRPKQKLLAIMAACGSEAKDIADALGITENTVRKVLMKPMIRKEIDGLQERIFGAEPKKKFAQIFPEAVTVARSIMHSETAKEGIKLKAAQDFMDRHAGKPLQRLETEQTMVSVLIARLDNSNLPIEPERPQSDNAIDITPEPEELELLAPPTQDLDEWVNENL